MPLAGRVRLSNFLLVAGVGVAALAGTAAGLGAWWLDARDDDDDDAPAPPPVVATPPPATPPPPRPTAIRGFTEPPLPNTRDVDLLVMEHLDRPLGADKVQDLAPDGPFKVNLYQDEGEVLPNRVKVDLDRDEKWDEKWTVTDRVRRSIAPLDDESYTLTFAWDGVRWLQDRGASAATPDAPAASGDLVADTVLVFHGKDIGVQKLKDATKHQPFKVNVYQDPGHATVNRAKVDLDRDDRWDEKWTLAPDRVTREIAPADDEVYSQVEVWTPARGWGAE